MDTEKFKYLKIDVIINYIKFFLFYGINVIKNYFFDLDLKFLG
jgi:hypothetical protein